MTKKSNSGNGCALVDVSKAVVNQVSALTPEQYDTWVHTKPLKGAVGDQYGGRRSLRMFESDLLEFFSRTPWWTVSLVWWPVIYWWMSVYGGGTAMLGTWFLYGFLAWFPSEYLMHRFVFHMRPTTPLQIQFHFMFHGIHHKAPRDEYRLVMPPIAAAAILSLFLAVFLLLFGSLHGGVFMCGFTFAYTLYDNAHYWIHHASPRIVKQVPLFGAFFMRIKKHHELHHYKEWQKRFGVTNMLLDALLGTVDYL